MTQPPGPMCEICNDTGWVWNDYNEVRKCGHRKPKEHEKKDREPGDDSDTTPF